MAYVDDYPDWLTLSPREKFNRIALRIKARNRFRNDQNTVVVRNRRVRSCQTKIERKKGEKRTFIPAIKPGYIIVRDAVAKYGRKKSTFERYVKEGLLHPIYESLYTYLNEAEIAEALQAKKEVRRNNALKTTIARVKGATNPWIDERVTLIKKNEENGLITAIGAKVYFKLSERRIRVLIKKLDITPTIVMMRVNFYEKEYILNRLKEGGAK